MKGFSGREGAGSISGHDVLPREFYSRETVVAARALLGKILVRRFRGGVSVEGRIVEAEAYRGKDDPASHAYRGVTERNKVMFQQVGLAYIYFIYGNHYCLNVTARNELEQAGAVLIRALEPVTGIKYMIRNRGLHKERAPVRKEVGTAPSRQLTNGPGKLTQAMRITGKQNGTDMADTTSDLFIREDPGCGPEFETVSTKRIGISEGEEKPWRFFIKDNEFVSKRK